MPKSPKVRHDEKEARIRKRHPYMDQRGETPLHRTEPGISPGMSRSSFSGGGFLAIQPGEDWGFRRAVQCLSEVGRLLP